MKLYGKEVSIDVLKYDMQYMNERELEAVQAMLLLEEKEKAIERMNKEKNTIDKNKMKALIEQGIYNLDTIFGPAK